MDEAAAWCPVPLGKASTCAEAVRLKRLEYILQFSSLSILYYDYAITLPDEVRYIWMRKWGLSTIFYFFCRYALVANVIYILAISEDVTGLDCSTGYLICGIMSIFGHIGIIAIWTLRTSAVYGNSRIVFGIFTVLGLAVVTLLSYRTRFLQCNEQVDMSKILGANAVIMMFIELLSFGLATYKVWSSSKEITTKNSTVGRLVRLNRIILSQGILYIGGVALLAVGQIAFNFKHKTGFASRLLNALKLPLSGFLTARFMLRLRAWNARNDADSRHDEHLLPQGTTTISSMKFRGSSVFDEFQGDCSEAGSEDAGEDEQEGMKERGESRLGLVREANRAPSRLFLELELDGRGRDSEEVCSWDEGVVLEAGESKRGMTREHEQDEAFSQVVLTGSMPLASAGLGSAGLKHRKLGNPAGLPVTEGAGSARLGSARDSRDWSGASSGKGAGGRLGTIRRSRSTSASASGSGSRVPRTPRTPLFPLTPAR